jgi:hypothetical protein
MNGSVPLNEQISITFMDSATVTPGWCSSLMNIPLRIRLKMFFQYGEVPPHFGQVAAYLNLL